MSTDTHLYLNSKYDLDEIKDVIERTQGKPVEIRAHVTKGLVGCYDFLVGNRRIFVISNAVTPLGSAIYLSLHADDEAHKILKAIANVFGGLFEAYDSDGNIEMIQGALSTEDGIPYFSKYAIMHDGIENDDWEGFIKSVKKWHTEIPNVAMPAIMNKLVDTIKDD